MYHTLIRPLHRRKTALGTEKEKQNNKKIDSCVRETQEHYRKKYSLPTILKSKCTNVSVYIIREKKKFQRDIKSWALMFTTRHRKQKEIELLEVLFLEFTDLVMNNKDST